MKHVCSLKSEHILMIREGNSFSDKFVRFWQNIFLVSLKNPRTKLYFRSHTQIEAEKMRQLTYRHKVIHPFSNFRIYYELLMMAVFLVHLLLTPWDMYLDTLYVHDIPFVGILWACFSFLCHITDICSTFFTGYEDFETKSVIIDLKKIRRRYVHSWIFIADLMAAVPLELILGSLPDIHAYHFRCVELLSIAKLSRLPTLIRYMNNAVDLWHISMSVYWSLRYVIFAILIWHWTSCMTAVTSQFFFIYTLNRTQENWIRAARLVYVQKAKQHYLKVLFRSLAQLLGVTHGYYPSLTSEDKIMTMVVFVVGYFLRIILLVMALQIIVFNAVPQLMNLAFLNQLDVYMTRIKLPQPQKKKFRSYFTYQFRENSFYDNDSLKYLSDRLRNEITMHLYRTLLSRANVISEFPQDKIDLMLTHLEREVYMPGDYIVTAGSIGTCMYFVVTGTIAITSFHGIEVCHLHDGAYFGEIALLLPENKRTANAIALEISEICRLDRKHFYKCIGDNLKIYQELVNNAMNTQRYVDNLNRLYTSNVKRKSMNQKNEEDSSLGSSEDSFYSMKSISGNADEYD